MTLLAREETGQSSAAASDSPPSASAGLHASPGSKPDRRGLSSSTSTSARSSMTSPPGPRIGFVTSPSADPASGPAEVVTPESVRAQLARWVAGHWDPGLSLREWRRLLAGSGWAVPSWPERWHGKGMPAWADDLVAAELIRLGAVGTPV